MDSSDSPQPQTPAHGHTAQGQGTGNELLPLQSLQGKEHAELLNAIDRVRGLGIGHEIPLPQLIVVGDQSSGKSSVLEAISGVKFPISEGTTTRFTTEIVLRHSYEAFAEVKIQSGQGRTGELVSFPESPSGPPSCTLENVPDLIAKAKQAMSLNRGFSNDILRLRISGPQCPHLTLVDLPGLVRNPEEGRTINDKYLVRNLVQRYMAEPRSVILAVVPAYSDKETEEILLMAREADETGKRTLGIVTKPDMTKPGSRSVDYYISCAKGEIRTFELGWHVVRNADFAERNNQNFDRDAEEKDYLSKPPWSQLFSSYKGIESLRRRLSQCLLDHIRSELPAVISEIEIARTLNEESIKRLGDSRPTAGEQRIYLTRIGEAYQRLVRDSVNGHYNSAFLTVLDDDSRKLRKLLRDRGDSFVKEMRNNGAFPEIFLIPQILNPRQRVESSEVDMAQEIWNGPLMRLIDLTLQSNRGWEPRGSYNPAVIIPPVFKEMSAHWLPLAQEFADSAWDQTRAFLETLLSEICEPDTCNNIWQVVLETELVERQKRLRSKLKDLATPYTRGHPFTFSSRADDWRNTIIQFLDDNGPRDACAIGEDNLVACKQVFAQCQTIYRIALETFADNVAILGIENELIFQLEDALAPAAFSSMNDEKIAAIATESPDTLAKREYFGKRNKDLEVALSVCSAHQKKYKYQERSRIKAKNTLARPVTPSVKPIPNVGSPSSISKNIHLSFTSADTQPQPGASTSSGSTSSGDSERASANTQPSTHLLNTPLSSLSDIPRSSNRSSGISGTLSAMHGGNPSKVQSGVENKISTLTDNSGHIKAPETSKLSTSNASQLGDSSGLSNTAAQIPASTSGPNAPGGVFRLPVTTSAITTPSISTPSTPSGTTSNTRPPPSSPTPLKGSGTKTNKPTEASKPSPSLFRQVSAIFSEHAAQGFGSGNGGFGSGSSLSGSSNPGGLIPTIAPKHTDSSKDAPSPSLFGQASAKPSEPAAQGFGSGNGGYVPGSSLFGSSNSGGPSPSLFGQASAKPSEPAAQGFGSGNSGFVPGSSLSGSSNSGGLFPTIAPKHTDSSKDAPSPSPFRSPSADR